MSAGLAAELETVGVEIQHDVLGFAGRGPPSLSGKVQATLTHCLPIPRIFTMSRNSPK